MKAIIFTISTLALLIGSKIDKTYNGAIESYFSSASIENSNSITVKATSYEGELIPVVELLSLNVFGIVEEGHKVETTLVNGERIPVVTLPELEIVASK